MYDYSLFTAANFTDLKENDHMHNRRKRQRNDNFTRRGNYTIVLSKLSTQVNFLQVYERHRVLFFSYIIINILGLLKLCIFLQM